MSSAGHDVTPATPARTKSTTPQQQQQQQQQQQSQLLSQLSSQPLPPQGSAKPDTPHHSWGWCKNRTLAVILLVVVVGLSLQSSMQTAQSVKLLYRISDIVPGTVHSFNESSGSGSSDTRSSRHAAMPHEPQSVTAVERVAADPFITTVTPDAGNRGNQEQRTISPPQIWSLDAPHTATDRSAVVGVAPRDARPEPAGTILSSAKEEQQQQQQQRQESTPPQKEIKDMNIVLFYADDWTYRSIGLLNPAVKTPHIDEIGKRGIIFPYNCVTTSICWQSRATLVTGLYVAVHQHLKIGDHTIFNGTVQWPLTLFPLLRSVGYHIGFLGKWHAPMPREFEVYTFDHFRNYYGSHWMWRNGRQKHVTECNGEDALEYLRSIKPKGQKFAMTVSFFATHAWDPKKYPDQYCPQNYTEHLYNETIPVPKTATDKHWKDMPWFFNEHNEGRGRWRQRYDTPEHYQVSMKRYYRMATEVDDVVGAVVQELKDQGAYDNTLIIFTTDNGNFHAEHGLADKWYPHEESIRVPLLIQDPRMPDHVRGTVNNEFTLNIDLAPTLLSAAGIPVPDYMQGRNIADLYLHETPQGVEQAAQTWRKDFFYEWTQGRPSDALGHNRFDHIPAVFALIRKDYKYFYWPQVQYEQVFRLEHDPYEEFDIINITARDDPEKLAWLKGRYHYLKNLSQTGHRV